MWSNRHVRDLRRSETAVGFRFWGLETWLTLSLERFVDCLARLAVIGTDRSHNSRRHCR